MSPKNKPKAAQAIKTEKKENATLNSPISKVTKKFSKQSPNRTGKPAKNNVGNKTPVTLKIKSEDQLTDALNETKRPAKKIRKFGGSKTVSGSDANTKSSAQLKQSVDSKAATKQSGSKKKVRRGGSKFSYFKTQISEGNEQVRKQLEEKIARLDKVDPKSSSLKKKLKRLRAVLNFANGSVKIVDKTEIISRAEAKANKTAVQSKPKGKQVLQGKSKNNKNVKTELEDEEDEVDEEGEESEDDEVVNDEEGDEEEEGEEEEDEEEDEEDNEDDADLMEQDDSSDDDEEPEEKVVLNKNKKSQSGLNAKKNGGKVFKAKNKIGKKK